MKNFHAWSLMYLFLAIWGCNKEPKPPSNNNTASTGWDGGFYVMNEGGFGYGNASLGYYRFSDSSYVPNVYTSGNGKLGDVLQSAWVSGTTAYLVLNNSGTIRQVDLLTGNELKNLNGLRSPRYVLPISNGKMLISDLYANAITITDTLLSGKLGTIFSGGWTEGMVNHPNGAVYVCHRSGNRVLEIDPITLTVTDSIPCHTAPAAIAVDRSGKLWVMSSGDAIQKIAPALEHWIPGKISERKIWTLPVHLAGLWPRLAMNSKKDQLYFLAEDVYAMEADALGLPTTPLIKAAGRNLYGLSYWSNSKGQEALVVTDALDYVQQGRLYQYDLSGKLTKAFKAGVIPNGVLVR